MGTLTHHDITVILLAIGAMLLLARLLGEVAVRLRQPAVVGEILAGVMLGPTVLGELLPQVSAMLFSPGTAAATVLAGLSTLAVVMFMLVAGIEVDLSRVFQQGRAAFTVGLSGIIVPAAFGLGAGFLMPEWLGRQPHVDPVIFAMFLAIALSISALPVIAKTLLDLNLFRSDMGVIVIASAVFNDLAGWCGFAVVLAMMGVGTAHGLGPEMTIAMTIAFAALMLTAGRWVIDRTLPWLQAKTTWPGGVLGASLVGAFFCAALTEWIGVHAVFGAFFFGVALGDSRHLRERTKTTIDQFVSFVFAPLFFVSIGLRVNFVEQFDWRLTLIVLLIACACKVVGCGLGARWAGLSWRESWAIGFGMNVRGAMEIILGLLALQYGVIGEPLFVALVIMAMVTSLLGGPMMQLVLRPRTARQLTDYLSPRTFILRLQSRDHDEAIRELATALAATTGVSAGVIHRAVQQRERMMSTALGNGAAVPHARLSALSTPAVALGLSPQGVEYDGPDAPLVHLIVLILTPRSDDGAQVELLAQVARALHDARQRERLMQVGSFNEALAQLKASAGRDSSGGPATAGGSVS